MISKLLLLSLLVFATFSLQLTKHDEEGYIKSGKIYTKIDIPYARFAQIKQDQHYWLASYPFDQPLTDAQLNKVSVHVWISCKGVCNSQPTYPVIIKKDKYRFHVNIPIAADMKNWYLNYQMIYE